MRDWTIKINGVVVAMPKEAIAYKYADAVDDARWVETIAEVNALEREGAPIEYPMPCEA